MTENRKRLLGILGLVPVVFFAFIVLRYSVNVPWFDDFDPFPDFLRKWILSDTLSEKLKLLFQPNNEHRMVFGKGLTLVYYILTGTLNFTFLHIAGMLFTFGTLVLIWQAFRWTKLPWLYFLPVPFFLFQLQDHLIFLWAICSLQHQPVVFFVCLSMFLLARGQFGWAILAAFCANFAMSNGIFVWVGGAGMLLFQARYRHLITWCAAGALSVGIYFTGMTSLNNESSLGFFFENPHLSFLGFFAFLGGLFDLTPDRSIQTRTVLPILMGILVMLWVGGWLLGFLMQWTKNAFGWPKKIPNWLQHYWLRSQAQWTEPGLNQFSYFCVGVMLFLLANAGVIALLRPRFGFFVMVVSNYKIYPSLFLIISYLAFIVSTNHRNRAVGFKVGLAVSIGIWVLTMIHYGPAISERRKYLLANAYNQEHHGFGLGHVPGSTQAAYVDSLMHFMTSRNMYRFPAQFEQLADELASGSMPIANSGNFRVSRGTTGLHISESEVEIPAGYDSGFYAFLKNGDSTYFFKMNQHRYSGRNLLIHYAPGVEVTVPYEALPPGTYQLGILRSTDSGSPNQVDSLRMVTWP